MNSPSPAFLTKKGLEEGVLSTIAKTPQKFF